MSEKTFPWYGPTIPGRHRGTEAEVFGWQDAVTIQIDDGDYMSSAQLSLEHARALAAQLIAAADYAEGVQK